jgi:hypothetical protein
LKPERRMPWRSLFLLKIKSYWSPATLTSKSFLKVTSQHNLCDIWPPITSTG